MSKEIQKNPPPPEPQPAPGQITLIDLMNAAKPLLQQWTDTQDKMHERDVSYDKDVLHTNAKQNRFVALGLFALLAMVFVIAGVLSFLGNASSAMDLITRVISLTAAAFGGYGWGVMTKRRTEKEKP